MVRTNIDLVLVYEVVSSSFRNERFAEAVARLAWKAEVEAIFPSNYP